MDNAKNILLIFLLFIFTEAKVLANTADEKKVNYISLSQNFLYAAKTGDNTSSFADSLKNIDQTELLSQLGTDHERLAFWLNIYNGYVQVLLRKNPDQYKTRNSFFSAKLIDISHQVLSFDDIEHGILRHSKVKWSEGYLTKLFPSGFEKKFRVEKLDYRIHFALNCGAKSCPPIAFYDPAQIDKQLKVAVKTYLKGECEYDSAKNVVKVPALMGWFRNDFGGKANMLNILKQNKIIPADSNPEIEFKTYDWSLYLNNYKSENNG